MESHTVKNKMDIIQRFLIVFVMLGMTTINSCKKHKEHEPDFNKDIIAEKTNVKTYEIINLIAHENLQHKYNATFGSAEIELFKTSDSTLTFYIPEIEEGEVMLKFDLATITFNVSKTIAVEANEFISTFTQNFNAQIDLLNPTTTDEITEVDSLNQYKQEVISLFNSLTDDEKRQTTLFYVANSELFKSFADNTFANLDAPTTKKQSDCPLTDFKSFYGCTAENLGDAAVGLKKASKEFLTMLTLAGVSAYLAPASFGLSAFGTTLALGTAGYLLITEVRPASLHFKHSLFPFLNANWIFGKALLFQATTGVFQDQVSTSLNLTPKFHSLTSNDGNVNSGSGYFITAMTSLSEYWNKLTAIFGNFPAYKNTEESTSLATNEVSISNISNSNVQFISNTGQSVKFKSLSGNTENFNYKISVVKEGFVEEKMVTGKVVVGLSPKDLLFRNGWQIVSGTSKFTKGSIYIDQAIGPSNYNNYTDCNNEFYSGYSWYNNGAGGFSTNYNWGVIKFIWSSTSGTYYTYYTDCTVYSSGQIEGSQGLLGAFSIDDFNESTLTAVNGDNLLKVIQISETDAIIEINRYPWQGVTDIVEKITLYLQY